MLRVWKESDDNKIAILNSKVGDFNIALGI